MKKVSLLLLTFIMLSSCVTTKKYKEVFVSSLINEGVADQYLNEINNLKTQIQKKEMDRVTAVQDTLRMHILMNRYKDEITNLREVNRKETGRVLRQLNDNQREAAVRIQRISNMESLVKSYEETIFNIKSELELLTLDYKQSGVVITQNNGRIVASMPNDVLFNKDNNNISTKGHELLNKFSLLMRTSPNINMSVVSYMDSSNVNSIKMWTEKSQRLNAISVDILNNKYITPDRVSMRIIGGEADIKTIQMFTKTSISDINIIFAPNLDILLDVISSSSGINTLSNTK